MNKSCNYGQGSIEVDFSNKDEIRYSNFKLCLDERFLQARDYVAFSY